ncbi:cell division protein FtsQ [Amnibacterium flavum]|uniref:Cell division protein FtsQ n=1 Tax=Amnibacterium flavum TaxID=2173173 RepID=A0A2V1HTD7_9MICO|nr:cell division protein FtsQ [Amnibacterium flavum]
MTGARPGAGRPTPPDAHTPRAREASPRSDVASARETARIAASAERSARRDLRRARRLRKRGEKAEVRRFTTRQRRARITLLVSVAVIGSLAGVVALGAFSPLFALREITVEGASRIPPADIVAALDDQMGTPLPLVDFSEVETELKGFPLIQSYVTESRPPGTLLVRIVERTPVGVVQTASGFDLVDSAGVTVESAAERIPGYPLIDLPSGDFSSVPFTAAASVLVALPAELLAQVDSISAKTVDDVTLGLTTGQKVVWGDAADSARKAQHLTRLLAQHPTDVTEYDVSSPGVGIIR